MHHGLFLSHIHEPSKRLHTRRILVSIFFLFSRVMNVGCFLVSVQKDTQFLYSSSNWWSSTIPVGFCFPHLRDSRDIPLSCHRAHDCIFYLMGSLDVFPSYPLTVWPTHVYELAIICDLEIVDLCQSSSYISFHHFHKLSPSE